MGEICKHFEKEDEGAADKESMFERVMELMQQVNSPLPLLILPLKLLIMNEAALLEIDVL